MVDPEWQGAGLGSSLHERMVEYAGSGLCAGSRPKS